MVVTKETYEVEGGFGYKVFIDGNLFITQPHAPAVSGHVIMSEAQANALAEKVVQKLSAQRTEAENTEMQNLAEKAGGRNFDSGKLTEVELARLGELARKGHPALSFEEVTGVINGG